MAATAVGDIYLVTIYGRIHGQTTLTTFKYELYDVLAPNPTTDTAALDIFAKWHAVGGMAEKFKAVTPTNWFYEQTWCQRIAPVRIIKTTSVVASGFGLRGSSTTTNNSATITRRGETASRSAVGGIRIPIAPTECLAGELAAGIKVDLQSLAVEMLLNITSIDLKFRPVLFTPAKLAPPVPASFHPILFTRLEPTARVMRRRTVGLGI